MNVMRGTQTVFVAERAGSTGTVNIGAASVAAEVAPGFINAAHVLCGAGAANLCYASLSSGLDIVRKTLGQYEIATVQTTAIDHTAGMANLTTTLAHASGEWIASDWPICPIAETRPQRMGAALTHARRYALFTLVGIAGDDDLDAPDLCVEPSVLPSEVPAGGQSWMPRRPGSGSARKGLKSEHPPTLDPDQSGAFRDKLLTEVKNVTSADCAAGWAREALAASQPMPISWRMHLSGGYPSSHSPKQPNSPVVISL